MVEGRFGDVGSCTVMFGIYMNGHLEILVNLISHISITIAGFDWKHVIFCPNFDAHLCFSLMSGSI